MNSTKASDDKEKPNETLPSSSCRTCFVGGGVRGHAPGAGPPTFGDHDGELVHGVRLQTRHRVTQGGRIRRLQRDGAQNVFQTTLCARS